MQFKKMTLKEWNEKFDCGLITSYRRFNNCGFEKNIPCEIDEFGQVVKEKPRVLTDEEIKNSKRNRALLIELLRLRYNLLSASLNSEDEKIKAIFVVDVNNKGTLKKDLAKLGVKYKQDSVLFLPKGTLNFENKLKAYLIGTNKCCNNLLKFGEIKLLEKKIFMIINTKEFFLEDILEKPNFLKVFSSGSQAMGANFIVKSYEKTIPLELIKELQKNIIQLISKR
ncbi:hypothetical protein LNAT_P0943 [Lebetimonas natsushimae]|uniref:Uncharacterized protein n=1 Tax=Lebetimonas natsushimae TaxID=1936991 RepID=A0A292YE68_9BACT|nr:hypothetical protein [Lebetimonas natsushimae]GAX87646.1 hypothetical protein LNAT_P0943 [Lebetimonas natsushimae]